MRLANSGDSMTSMKCSSVQSVGGAQSTRLMSSNSTLTSLLVNLLPPNSYFVSLPKLVLHSIIIADRDQVFGKNPQSEVILIKQPAHSLNLPLASDRVLRTEVLCAAKRQVPVRAIRAQPVANAMSILTPRVGQVKSRSIMFAEQEHLYIRITSVSGRPQLGRGRRARPGRHGAPSPSPTRPSSR